MFDRLFLALGVPVQVTQQNLRFVRARMFGDVQLEDFDRLVVPPTVLHSGTGQS
jgi:hypothetical protein